MIDRPRYIEKLVSLKDNGRVKIIMYKLTEKKVKEYTNASTTGMLDSSTNNYSLEISSSRFSPS